MADFNKPIKTLAEARVFFKTMACSHQHMGRDYPERYREYQRLCISKERERKWREESLAQLSAQAASPDTGPGDLWRIHSRMADLVSTLKTVSSLECMHETTVQIADRLPARDKVIVAETIHGRQHIQYRSGLIFLAYDLGRKDLAASFAALAGRFCQGARRPFQPQWERCRRALAQTREIRRLLNI